ncbi:hypothetical protein Zmor_026658 [Zophobas morio]|uniref:Uncharacterized protein n=1 Tax=Zophobas morio TaxID=2755281 RepID=A0AA38HZM5_9CUCU|nr:hypothetical protein Zmor_026658 [Zophobas morio]
MGRRKWKLYQESMSRNYLQPLNNNVKTPKDHHNNNHNSNKEVEQNNHHEKDNNTATYTSSSTPKNDDGGGDSAVTTEHKEKENEKTTLQPPPVEDRLKDWTPETKCYFCVDGKLDSEHTAHGVLVITLTVKISGFFVENCVDSK